MRTISGINIVPGETNAPSLYDIGYALSQTSRFGGHTKKPWTVLQHLYAAANLAKLLGFDELIQLHALLHDAHEAIIGDIPNPWKTEDMRQYQHELDTRIYLNIGIDLPSPDDQIILKEIDTMLLYAEAEVIGPKKINNSDPLARKAMRMSSRYTLPPHSSGKEFEKAVKYLLGKLVYATTR